jgi:AhpD family alkylhydroperoxidase
MNVAPKVLQAMYHLEHAVKASGLEPSLLKLVKLRASYINGCAFCIDMHAKEARAAGETEQRVYSVPVWHETPFYTERERAALAWTEVVTNVAQTGVPDEAFAAVRAMFSEEETVNLTMAIGTINVWNRLAVSFRTEPGTYVVPKEG